LQAEFFRGPAPVLTTGQNGVRFIDKNARAMRLGYGDELGQVSEIAIHGINTFEHDELSLASVSA
jgi:hypothetical protein